MSPLPRLHHHDIMTIVELFFIYVPFVTIGRIMCVSALQSSTVSCSQMVRAQCYSQGQRQGMGFFPSFFCLCLKCDKTTLSWHGVITPQYRSMNHASRQSHYVIRTLYCACVVNNTRTVTSYLGILRMPRIHQAELCAWFSEVARGLMVRTLCYSQGQGLGQGMGISF